MKYVNGRRTGLVIFCVETAFYNGLLKERYKGGIEVTERQGRRRRKLLDDLKERRGYCHLKEEARIMYKVIQKPRCLHGSNLCGLYSAKFSCVCRERNDICLCNWAGNDGRGSAGRRLFTVRRHTYWLLSVVDRRSSPARTTGTRRWSYLHLHRRQGEECMELYLYCSVRHLDVLNIEIAARNILNFIYFFI